jgi:hypothetical protein
MAHRLSPVEPAGFNTNQQPIPGGKLISLEYLPSSQDLETGVPRRGTAVMTSIFSIVIVFTATFLLVFAYLTHPEQGSRHANVETPPASVSEFAR